MLPLQILLTEMAKLIAINPFVSLARGLGYAAVLLLFGFNGGPGLAAKAWMLTPIMLLALLVLEVGQRWRRTARYGSAIAAIIDFALTTTLTVWLHPGLILLFALVIVADGARENWKIALLLGFGAAGINTMIAYRTPASNGQAIDIVIRIFFWLALTGITATLAWRHERDCISRAALAKNAQIRSDRLSMLSHEVRTPLTLMRASLELLFDESAGPLTEQQSTFLETIFQNVERIAALAQNLLTQARLESGVFSPKTQSVDLRRIVRLVVNDIHILLKQRNQQIRTYYPQVLPLIQVDPGLIRQVLINLIRNASRYTSAGGLIVVSIAQNDYALFVSVTDDGAGMGLEHRRQLFQRFSTSGDNSGEHAGLGLVIVKQIVEWHGGRVYVDTSMGRGTSFYFTLPFKAAGSTT